MKRASRCTLGLVPGILVWVLGSAATAAQIKVGVPQEIDPATAATMQKVAHYLPLAPGSRWEIAQGNDQTPTHNDVYNRWAFDFWTPVGTPVHASADGVVVYLKMDTEGPTGNYEDNNEIGLRHTDGTFATYAHLRKDGATVKLGDEVMAGDLIGYSGNTGNSGGPHLHFNLRIHSPRGPCIPCRFSDVEGDGVPEKGEWVVSNNLPTRALIEPLQQLEALLVLCTRLEAPLALKDVLGEVRKRGMPAETRAWLGKTEDREDLHERCEAMTKAFLEDYQALGKARLESIPSLLEEGELDAAVRAAVFGEEDFALLGQRSDFRAAHAPLREQEGYTEALKALRAERKARSALTRVVERQIAAQQAQRKGKKVDWAKLQKEYRKVAGDWPTPEGKVLLETHAEELGAVDRTPAEASARR